MAQQMVAPPLSPEGYQLAARYQLGAPVAEYRRWLRPLEGVSSAFFLLMGVFLIVIAASSTVTSAALLLLVLGLLFLGATFIWPLLFLINRGHCVYVCAEGLVQVKGRQVDVARWDQVVSFVQDITRHTYRVYLIPVVRYTSHAYTVHLDNGARLTFNDSLRHVERLGTMIERAAAQRLTPRALAAYNSGAPVFFGDLGISQQGITRGQKFLPWSQFQGYEISDGVLTISQQGKFLNWASIAVSQFPNLLVFVHLMDYLQRGQRQAAR